MKVIIDSIRHIRRGGPVEIGNVYSNPHGKNVFKIVVGKIKEKHHNIVLLNVNHKGEVVRGVNEPECYIRDHQDLVGKVKSFPTLKIEWLRDE